jgi:hypothetical protein
MSGQIAGAPIKVGGQEAVAPNLGADLKSLGFNMDSLKGMTHDVVHDYPWTLSNVSGRDDIPNIILNEHRQNEGTLVRAMAFYGMAAETTAGNVGSALKNAANKVAGVVGAKPFGPSRDALLKVYEEIFPDSPTNNRYIFPYFSKTAFELNTSQWEQIDDAATAAAGLAGGAADLVGAFGGKNAARSRYLKMAQKGIQAGDAGNEALLKAQYPVVGVFDRPRVFTSHSERAITIEFPLFNTKNAFDWTKNRDLLYKLMTQNLYNKRDYITGSPPCFYRVLIPGQYFSFASCVTNINVQHLGNTRVEGGSYIVPDAYQVSLTLTEMVMPSLNQFQAVTTGEAGGRVTVG